MSRKVIEATDTLEGVSVEERAVLYVLADHANDEGVTPELSARQISREAGKWMKRARYVDRKLRMKKQTGK